MARKAASVRYPVACGSRSELGLPELVATGGAAGAGGAPCVDADGDYAHPTLALDGAGVVHVLWHSAQGLEYARRTPDAGIDQDCDGKDG